MSEEKFTPAPWVYSQNRDTHDYVIHKENPRLDVDGSVSECDGIIGCSEWMWLEEANAHLIAAAPEMYELLESIAVNEMMTGDDAFSEQINELLAKARGEKC